MCKIIAAGFIEYEVVECEFIQVKPCGFLKEKLIYGYCRMADIY